jgi:hypothetical protein
MLSVKHTEDAMPKGPNGEKRRVISKKAMANALRLQSEGGNAFVRTMSRRGVRSVLSDDLAKKIENPIFFKPLGGGFSGLMYQAHQA